MLGTPPLPPPPELGLGPPPPNWTSEPDLPSDLPPDQPPPPPVDKLKTLPSRHTP